MFSSNFNLNLQLVPTLVGSNNSSITRIPNSSSNGNSSNSSNNKNYIGKLLSSLDLESLQNALTFSTMSYHGDLSITSPNISVCPSLSNSRSNSINSISLSRVSSINSIESAASGTASTTASMRSNITMSNNDFDENTLATVHNFWQLGKWTTAMQEAKYFNSNLFIQPQVTIIEPNNMQNVIVLSEISSNYSPSVTFCQDLTPTFSGTSIDSKFDDAMSTASGVSSFHGSTSSPSKLIKKLKSFKDYVFFSNTKTKDLRERLGISFDELNDQSLYQFEARKFQFSILRGDLRFIKDYRSGSETLIFKFGRAGKNNTFYGVCERNDRQPERQPWCCKDIKTLRELVTYFGFNQRNISIEAKNEFMNYMRIDDNCINKTFDATMDYHSNVNKIARMLKHGMFDYVKGLERRSCDHFSDESCSSQYSNNSRHSGRSTRSRNGRRGRKNGNFYNNNNNNKGSKLKNEDKFAYLEAIGSELGVNTKVLLSLISEAIENAFLFAREHPETVLTQAYIDEERASISFELVLIAEIVNERNGKYYKFAVPIVECENRQTKASYYEAKNILTPKMAVDNVRLNSNGACLNKNAWIVDLENGNFNNSYYKRIDSKWFEKLGPLRAEMIQNKKNRHNNNNKNKQNIETIPLSKANNNNNNNNNNTNNNDTNNNIENVLKTNENGARKTPRAMNLPRVLTFGRRSRHSSENIMIDIEDDEKRFEMDDLDEENFDELEDVSVFSKSVSPRDDTFKALCDIADVSMSVSDEKTSSSDDNDDDDNENNNDDDDNNVIDNDKRSILPTKPLGMLRRVSVESNGSVERINSARKMDECNKNGNNASSFSFPKFC